MRKEASDFEENLVFNFVKFQEGAHPHYFLVSRYCGSGSFAVTTAKDFYSGDLVTCTKSSERY